MAQKIGWLILGALLGLFVGSYLFRKSTEQTDAQRQRTYSVELQQLESKVNNLTQDRDACRAKFQRSTILYDGVMNVDRGWLIPADVEPTLLGNRPNASYTHFDPKTQTETVKLQPKRAQ